jgi:hypothetical protein
MHQQLDALLADAEPLSMHLDGLSKQINSVCGCSCLQHMQVTLPAHQNAGKHGALHKLTHVK